MRDGEKPQDKEKAKVDPESLETQIATLKKDQEIVAAQSKVAAEQGKMLAGKLAVHSTPDSNSDYQTAGVH